MTLVIIADGPKSNFCTD